MNHSWVIAGKPDDAIPEIGKEYEIRDSRKGTFKGVVLNVSGEFADIEVTEGRPKFASEGYRLEYDGHVSIRASLVYLVEL